MSDVGSRRSSRRASTDMALERAPSDSALVRFEPLLTFSVVALALIMRLPWPSAWWLNPDEGIYYAAITQSRFAGFWADAKATAHPPLYFLILRAIGTVTTDFAWLRSVAWVSGIAAVYLFTRIGREIGGEGDRGVVTGVLAGLLIAVSPRAVSLSGVIRPYMLLLLLVSGSLLALLRYMRRPSPASLVAYGALSSLALTLHYSALLALGVFGVLVLTDGVRRGFARRAWLPLAAVQLVPALTLAVMYWWHLRRLMRSAMATQALQGWLSSYLIRSPADVWLGLVGFHSSLLGDTLAVSATFLTLLGLAVAAWTRRWIPFVLGFAGIALAYLGAFAHLYPLGATRHTSWLTVFVTPVLAWLVATLVTSSGRTRALAIPMLAALLLGARPLAATFDSDARPREISERVLRVDYLDAMSDVLDPSGTPRLVLMSTETYQLLMPLYTDERQGADASADGLLLHFGWGARDVVVLPDRDFLVLPTELGRPNHLYTAARRATEEFGLAWPPDVGESALVLEAGWRSQGMEDLAELSRRTGFLGSTTYVPGFIAVRLDLAAYARALGLPPN